MPRGKSRKLPLGYCLRGLSRICQGDIIKKLDLVISSKGGSSEFSLTPSFEYGVILTQECDLEQHYSRLEKNSGLPAEDQTHDQLIDSVLICPAFAFEQFMSGSHMADKKMQNLGNSDKAKDKVKRNDEYPRYHYLPEIEDVLPDLVVDFKRFYSVPIAVFDQTPHKMHLASISDLFRERLSQRFTNYLARIALPEN